MGWRCDCGANTRVKAVERQMDGSVRRRHYCTKECGAKSFVTEQRRITLGLPGRHVGKRVPKVNATGVV